jgi:hypothetical protein
VKLHVLEELVGKVALLARAVFHVDGRAKLHEFGGNIGGQGDARLVDKGLLQHPDTEWHPTAPCF